MLACCALAWGAFAFGGVYPWAYWPLAGLCAVAGLTGLLTRRGIGHEGGLRAVTAALVLVAGVIALQILPLPAWLLAAVSPHAPTMLNELDARFAWGLLNVHGVSLDPAATARALVLFLAFALLMVGLARGLSQGEARRLAWVITCAGIALAITGVVQKALSSTEVYGFWKPLMSGSPFGPFVNKNHFAGWMLMAIPLALGYFCSAFSRGKATVRPTFRDWFLWLASRDASRALLAGFAVVLMGVSLSLTLSRSGMLSLAVALIVCSYAAVRRQSGTLGRSAIFGCLMLSALVIVVWAGTDAIVARFAAADTMALGGRILIWQTGILMLKDFWLAGSGVNTFGVATLFYPGVDPARHLQQAHNDYLQLAVEGGVVLTAAVVVAAIVFALTVRRRFQSGNDQTYWIRLGAVSGIIAIAVQSLVEFSLQMPGNAALFATLGALALHRDGGTPRPSTSS